MVSTVLGWSARVFNVLNYNFIDFDIFELVLLEFDK